MEPNDFLDMSKGVKDIAILLYEYKEALLSEGFSEGEAYEMTKLCQTVIITAIWTNAVKGNKNER